MSDEFCPVHSAVETRLQHLEKELDEMDKRQRELEKRFTQILITLIFLLVGVVANLGYALVK